jgi:hypothetical protein
MLINKNFSLYVRYASEHLEVVQSFPGQQMHYLLKHKMLQLTLKISLYMLLHVLVHSDHHQGAYDGTLLKLPSL